jgi:hypothetical protein
MPAEVSGTTGTDRPLLSSAIGCTTKPTGMAHLGACVRERMGVCERGRGCGRGGVKDCVRECVRGGSRTPHLALSAVVEGIPLTVNRMQSGEQLPLSLGGWGARFGSRAAPQGLASCVRSAPSGCPGPWGPSTSDSNCSASCCEVMEEVLESKSERERECVCVFCVRVCVMAPLSLGHLGLGRFPPPPLLLLLSPMPTWAPYPIPYPPC